jgi:hypothetical protein
LKQIEFKQDLDESSEWFDIVKVFEEEEYWKIIFGLKV